MHITKKNYPFDKLILILLLGSASGLFMPWLYFDRNVDYATGLEYLQGAPLLFAGSIGAIVLCLLKDRSQGVNIVNLVFLLMIPLSCARCFLTWHIMGVTGRLDLSVSFSTAHYGFYVTFFCSLAATLLFAVSMVKMRRSMS